VTPTIDFSDHPDTQNTPKSGALMFCGKAFVISMIAGVLPLGAEYPVRVACMFWGAVAYTAVTKALDYLLTEHEE